MTVRKVFAWSAALLVVVIVVQFFLAASAAFDTAPKDESFQSHRALGYGIVVIALLVTVLAAVARVPGRLVGMTGLIAGLAVVQGLIRALAGAFGETGRAGPLVFGLHAVNALAIMALAMTVTRTARTLATRTTP
jgi:hypothetical protein